VQTKKKEKNRKKRKKEILTHRQKRSGKNWFYDSRTGITLFLQRDKTHTDTRLWEVPIPTIQHPPPFSPLLVFFLNIFGLFDT